MSKDPKRKQIKLAGGESDAVICHEIDGSISTWSTGAVRMFGYEPEEICGKHINQIVPEGSRKQYWRNVSLVESKQSLPWFDLKLRAKSGDLLNVSMSVARHAEKDSISITARDISRQKEAEARVDELYSTVSHELRTPLTSIYGALSTLDDGLISLDSEDARELVSIARNSTSRLLRIINDILDFRKLESGKLDFTFDVESAGNILSESINAMSAMADEKGVRLINASSQELQLSADRGRIVQVLNNLLSNAIKFSPSGSEVSVLAVLRRSGSVRFSVTDSGPGIPRDVHNKLFEKFYQVDSSDTRQSEGTGLGLAICKSIVEQHGGTIGFSSNAGRGSTFWFELKAIEKRRPSATTVTTFTLKLALILSQNDSSVNLINGTMADMKTGCRLMTQLHDLVQMLEKEGPGSVIINTGSFPPAHILDAIREVTARAWNVNIVLYSTNSDATLFSWPLRVKWISTDARILVDCLKEEIKQQARRKRLLIVSADDEVPAVAKAELSKTCEIIWIKTVDELSVQETREARDYVLIDLHSMTGGNSQVKNFFELARRSTAVFYSTAALTAHQDSLVAAKLFSKFEKKEVSEIDFVDALREAISGRPF